MPVNTLIHNQRNCWKKLMKFPCEKMTLIWQNGWNCLLALAPAYSNYILATLLMLTSQSANCFSIRCALALFKHTELLAVVSFPCYRQKSVFVIVQQRKISKIDRIRLHLTGKEKMAETWTHSCCYHPDTLNCDLLKGHTHGEIRFVTLNAPLATWHQTHLTHSTN